nr:apolipoprotein Ea isoform X2 [Doryrhamphus excisus]XP_057903178.1 apolipoprotein Ea isoform X2 [Doryrhamphus excisus]XP_057903179.1 apolipoprotein Ea isoform X2 [Doryrhamphus excisus]XP_057903180.1 apolipoprotein Ea isoform X2 [Doryrhamphus excisus]
MRVFLIIVTLAVISGCQARSVVQDEFTTPWEAAVENFKNYMTALNEKADGMVKDIKSSQIKRELDTLIQDSMAELDAYREDLEIKLAPYTQETAKRLGSELRGLAEHLYDHMIMYRDQMETYSQELNTLVKQNADDIRLKVSAYTRKMKKRLSKDTMEIKTHVATYFEKLQARTSNNMEDLRVRLQPYFAQVRDNTQAKITTLNDLLKAQVESMKDQIQSTADDIKESYEKTSENLRSTLQDKMEELRSWFQPFVSMITENM